MLISIFLFMHYTGGALRDLLFKIIVIFLTLGLGAGLLN